MKRIGLSELDQRLLTLLSEDARASVSAMAQRLGVSRVTVQSHMEQLQRQKIIRGFTVSLDLDYLESKVSAHILIATEQKKIAAVVRVLEKMSEVKALHSISGEFDLVAQVRVDSPPQLDEVTDAISQADGVQRTLSSVVLAKKFERQ